MSKHLYKVTAIFHGIISHASYIQAKSEDDAIQLVKIYHLKPGTRYGTIKAVAVREVMA